MSDYYKKPCQFNLVELSLLARLHKDFCIQAKIDQKLHVPDILLKMKATEKKGTIEVLFHVDTPVGFHWFLPDESFIVFHPDHSSAEARQCLLGPIA